MADPHAESPSDEEDEFPAGDDDGIDPFDFDARPFTPERDGPRDSIAALLNRRSLVDFDDSPGESPPRARPPVGSAGRSRRKSSAARSLRGRGSVVALGDDGELEPFDFDASPPGGQANSRRQSEAPEEGVLTRLLSRRRTLSDTNLRAIPLPRALSHAVASADDDEDGSQQFASAADLINAALSLGSGQFTSMRSPPDPRLPSFRAPASPTSAPRIDDVLADLTPTNSDADGEEARSELAPEASFVIKGGLGASQFGFTLSPTEDFTEAVRRARLLGIEVGETKARDILLLNERVVLCRLEEELEEGRQRVDLLLHSEAARPKAPDERRATYSPLLDEEERARAGLGEQSVAEGQTILRLWHAESTRPMADEEGRIRSEHVRAEREGRDTIAKRTAEELRLHQSQIDEVRRRAEVLSAGHSERRVIQRRHVEDLETVARAAVHWSENTVAHTLRHNRNVSAVAAFETRARNAVVEAERSNLASLRELGLLVRQALALVEQVREEEAAAGALLEAEAAELRPHRAQASWEALATVARQEADVRTTLFSAEGGARSSLGLRATEDLRSSTARGSCIDAEGVIRLALVDQQAREATALRAACRWSGELVQFGATALRQHQSLLIDVNTQWKAQVAKAKAEHEAAQRAQRQIDRTIEGESKGRRLLRNAEKASRGALAEELRVEGDRLNRAARSTPGHAGRRASGSRESLTPTSDAAGEAKRRLADLRAVDHWKRTLTALTEVDRAFTEEEVLQEDRSRQLRPPRPPSKALNPLGEVRSPVAPLDRPKGGFVRRIVLGSEKQNDSAQPSAVDSMLPGRTGRPKAMSISARPASREVTPLSRQRFSISESYTTRRRSPPEQDRKLPSRGQNAWVELNPVATLPPQGGDVALIAGVGPSGTEPTNEPPQTERRNVEPEPISVHTKAAASAAKTAKRKALEMVRRKFAGYF